MISSGHKRPAGAGGGSHDPSLHPVEQALKQRSLLLRIARVAFIALLTVVTLLTILKINPGAGEGAIALALGWPITLVVALVLAAIVILVDVLTPTKKISTLFSVFFGLLGAMLATVAVGFIVDLLASTYDIRAPEIVATTKVLIGIALAYLGITTVLQTQDDFRLVIPYVELAKQYRGPRPLLLDTSALIDGRLVDIAGTGLIQSPLVIPRFVVEELQKLADLGDKVKRLRGRRGLDMIARLQRTAAIDVSIDETIIAPQPVDQMLVELAREMNALIVTTDAGLTRIAQIQGVTVANLHDLAGALRPTVVPGEQLTIRILRPGEQPGQGVGYLDDGTMIVVEDGAAAIGEDAPVVVGSALQTSAGRMIFAKLARRSGSFQIPASDAAAAASPEQTTETTPDPPEAPALPQTLPAEQSPAGADGAPDSTRTPIPHPRGPFPPKTPSSLRQGTPRNPRR
jgi:uncharacterized protein YacL